MFFFAEYRLKSHMNIHAEGRELKVQCPQCPKKFFTNKHLVNHKYVHSGEKSFLCVKCESSFKRMSGLKSHMKTHRDEKPKSCNFCGKYFRFSGHLKQHQDAQNKLNCSFKSELHPFKKKMLES